MRLDDRRADHSDQYPEGGDSAAGGAHHWRRSGRVDRGHRPCPPPQRSRAESYAAFTIPGRTVLRVPVATGSHVTRILGRPRLTGVEVENIDTGQRQLIACDTVIFTGD